MFTRARLKSLGLALHFATNWALKVHQKVQQICGYLEISTQKNRKLLKTYGIFVQSAGAPYGTRTRVSAVKGRRPRPLDEGR